MQAVSNKAKYTLFTGKALAFLIIPIVIESALSMSLGLVDSLMVKDIGNLGKAMGAVSNVDQISNLIIQLFTAFGVGGAVITSQYLGAGKVAEANKSAKQLMVLMFSASVLVMALCLALNNQLISLFFPDMDEEYLSYAHTYFYVMAASYPFLALFNCSAALLRAQRKSMNTMLSGAISFVINVAFNAIFIYACKWGILGAALATLIARIFPAVFLLILLSNKKNLVKIKVFEKFRFNGGMLKKIVKLALPSGIENCLFQLGKLLTASFIAIGCYKIFLDGNPLNLADENVTNIQVTANSIAFNINTISSIFGNGVNTAILTVIGQAVGTGKIGQVKFYIRRMLTISYIGNAACVGLAWAFSPLLIRAFGSSITPETAQIAQRCLNLCLAVQFLTYPLSFGLPAVLKANSDMKYVMFAAVASMLTMRVGLCYFLTCEWAGIKLGALGLWIGMVSDWVLRSVLFGARLASGRWKKSSGLLNGDAESEEREKCANILYLTRVLTEIAQKEQIAENSEKCANMPQITPFDEIAAGDGEDCGRENER